MWKCKRLKRGFQPKNRHGLKSKQFTYPTDSKWIERLSRDDFEQVTRTTSTGIIYGPTPENKIGTAKYLRPRTPVKETVHWKLITKRTN